MAKFEIKRTSDKEYRFNLKASNGKVILASETYNTLTLAKKSIETVRTNSANDSMFERHTARNGKCYFTIKARNGRVIGQSQMYANTASMEKGIRAVKSAAPGARSTEVKEKAYA